MNRDELQSTLAALHEELSQTSEVDEQTRQMLQHVTDDIRRLLAENPDGSGGQGIADGQGASEQQRVADGPEGAEPAATYSSRLKEMVFEFEANHPKIGSLLERLSDGLANMGI